MSAPTETIPSATDSAQPLPAASWWPVIWLGALLALACSPVLASLVKEWWTNDDMVHGFFCPVVAGYIIWHKREELLAAPSSPSRWGLALIVWAAAQFVFGSAGASVFLPRTAFLFSLIGLILYFRGPRTLRILAFPLLLLFFMIPPPSYLYKPLVFQLQLVASRLAEISLEVLGYSVLREGNILQIPGHQLSVARACSGLRSLLSILFLTLSYSYLLESKTWIRVALVLASVPIAIAANAGRVTLTAVLVGKNEKLAQGLLHDASAWVLAGLVLLVVFVLHSFFKKFSHVASQEA